MKEVIQVLRKHIKEYAPQYEILITFKRWQEDFHTINLYVTAGPSKLVDTVFPGPMKVSSHNELPEGSKQFRAVKNEVIHFMLTESYILDQNYEIEIFQNSKKKVFVSNQPKKPKEKTAMLWLSNLKDQVDEHGHIKIVKGDVAYTAIEELLNRK